MAPRLVSAALAAALLAGLAGCDRPGPYSSASLGERALPPIQPAWGRDLHNRPLKQVFPAVSKCIGFIDHYAERYAGARKVVGWSWNASLARPVDHLAAVDSKGRMVAFGAGGDDRPDVGVAHPEFGSHRVGWTLVAPTRQARYTLFGLDEASGSACDLGVLEP